ncbi:MULTISPECIES: hypothetical protein [Halobacterium]|uniref:DUF7124 domain-containing protein n=1 Tax=Halobacterium TaxID=2239 RepID=UPI00073F9310|nr:MULTISPECIES: hypothetical protein [Halobacterium]MCG1002666.1 hypothetical protein [Halobacterium noricense]
MTERIDLDDVEVETDEADGNDGDWLWRNDGSADIDGDVGEAAGADSTGTTPDSGTDDATEQAGDSQGDRIPHVPYESSDSPAGIPKDHGGAGGGAGPAEERVEAPEANGPHGGGVDKMATAYTYEAVQRLDDPRVALAETNEWSDWVGLVGDVPAHAINSFLREHQLDIDFFNGSGDGPAERLAAIDEHSMFYSERMVVVGTDGEQWIAEEAGWEFVDLADAAESAGWELLE